MEALRNETESCFDEIRSGTGDAALLAGVAPELLQQVMEEWERLLKAKYLGPVKFTQERDVGAEVKCKRGATTAARWWETETFSKVDTVSVRALNLPSGVPSKLIPEKKSEVLGEVLTGADGSKLDGGLFDESDCFSEASLLGEVLTGADGRYKPASSGTDGELFDESKQEPDYFSAGKLGEVLTGADGSKLDGGFESDSSGEMSRDLIEVPWEGHGEKAAQEATTEEEPGVAKPDDERKGATHQVPEPTEASEVQRKAPLVLLNQRAGLYARGALVNFFTFDKFHGDVNTQRVTPMMKRRGKEAKLKGGFLEDGHGHVTAFAKLTAVMLIKPTKQDCMVWREKDPF